MGFNLDPRLEETTFCVDDWSLCRVLRAKDKNYPWFILVPRQDGLREIHDLSPDNQKTLLGEITQTSQALQNSLNPDKINVAALGNVVPQLHIHVVARFETDMAWPGPIWGAVAPDYYHDEDKDRIVQDSCEILGIEPPSSAKAAS